MKPKDNSLFGFAGPYEMYSRSEKAYDRGRSKQTHSKGQTHPGNVNNLERTRRDETEEHEHTLAVKK